MSHLSDLKLKYPANDIYKYGVTIPEHQGEYE